MIDLINLKNHIINTCKGTDETSTYFEKFEVCCELAKVKKDIETLGGNLIFARITTDLLEVIIKDCFEETEIKFVVDYF